MVQYSSQWYQ